MKEKEKVCCFFGHRSVAKKEEIREKLFKIILELIETENVTKFLFGSKSEFDKLCYAVVTELKEKYPSVYRVYVRAEFQYINDDYKQYLLESYEDTYFPERASNAGRTVYVERNQEMIDRADVCVVYYDEDYEPPQRKQSMKSLFPYQPASGTRIAYDYAVRKKRQIINVIDI